MAAKPELSVRQNAEIERRPSESASLEARGARERYLTPTVDIFEDAYRITVVADLPGVSKEKLNVRADRNSLVIEGTLSIETPQGMQALSAEVQATKYRRSFVLTGELDPERIDAALKDGVLTVRIPKREEFRTRKINVQVA